MIDIRIKSIPHNSQQYETVGDYWTNRDGSIEIRVSQLPLSDYELLIALHELIEYWLVKNQISEDSINQFDKQFEASRQPGNEDEPGDDPNATYRKQHLLATGVEKIIAAELGIDWKAYEAAVNSLNKTINNTHNHE